MKIKGLIIIATLALLGACNSTQGGLYWGNYSDTLYDLKKEPGEKAQKNHLRSLNDIVATSDKKGTRIPPGVLVELAIIEIENVALP